MWEMMFWILVTMITSIVTFDWSRVWWHARRTGYAPIMGTGHSGVQRYRFLTPRWSRADIIYRTWTHVVRWVVIGISLLNAWISTKWSYDLIAYAFGGAP